MKLSSPEELAESLARSKSNPEITAKLRILIAIAIRAMDQEIAKMLEERANRDCIWKARGLEDCHCETCVEYRKILAALKGSE